MRRLPDGFASKMQRFPSGRKLQKRNSAYKKKKSSGKLSSARICLERAKTRGEISKVTRGKGSPTTKPSERSRARPHAGEKSKNPIGPGDESSSRGIHITKRIWGRSRNEFHYRGAPVEVGAASVERSDRAYTRAPISQRSPGRRRFPQEARAPHCYAPLRRRANDFTAAAVVGPRSTSPRRRSVRARANAYPRHAAV